MSLSESAMLVGLLKNSSLYNPLRRPELVRERRNIVYQQMLRNQLIDQKEKDSLAALPIEVDFNPQSHREGIATYFRAYLQEFMKLQLLMKMDVLTTINSRLMTLINYQLRLIYY